MRFKAVVIILGLENFMLPCFTKQIIGIDCPGCGLQRSALFLLKGEFWNAFHMYPAIYIDQLHFKIYLTKPLNYGTTKIT